MSYDWEIAHEHFKYADTKNYLDQIVSKGKDYYFLSYINTEVSGLPEHKLSPLERLLKTNFKPEYKLPEESNRQYLDRVIDTFDFCVDEEKLVCTLRKKDLYLFFNMPHELEAKKEEVTLFKPDVTFYPEIKVEMEVRRRYVTLQFTGFKEKDENAEKLRFFSHYGKIMREAGEHYKVDMLKLLPA